MHILSCTNTLSPTSSCNTANRVAYVAVLAVTAACAEEVGRYIAFRFFVKNPEQQNTPLYFGLGHGGIEALSVGVNNVILLINIMQPFYYYLLDSLLLHQAVHYMQIH